MSDRVLITRNQIFNAALALGAGAVWGSRTFSTATRKWREPESIPPDELPCLVQVEAAENVATQTGMPPRRTFELTWLAFFNTDVNDKTDLGQAVAADIVDALARRIASDGPDDQQTLGGLVHNLHIADTILKVSGDDTGLGMVVVPLRIEVP